MASVGCAIYPLPLREAYLFLCFIVMKAGIARRNLFGALKSKIEGKIVQ
jgi:hypothetical protein